MPSRDLTVVRIPLKRAKHHFGVASSRGQRSYNEDTNQAGTISMPAFAKRAPISLQRRPIQKPNEATSADSALGDPQVFYFGIFDGHGGTQCAEFLRDELHGYIEQASADFGLQSSLKTNRQETGRKDEDPERSEELFMKTEEEVRDEIRVPEQDKHGVLKNPERKEPLVGVDPVSAKVDDIPKAVKLEQELVEEYRQTVGGYFRRFNPQYFKLLDDKKENDSDETPVTVESVLMLASQVS
ncbi:protein phosphatase 2c [Colletotrichum higginsianum]|uniref:Protein phosphatase 2c n=1 Tax=Colletotrichum higginsianum (strain IMI 349063) TaxID=759273 RepID=H1UWB4_COLHI|nr:protein phosphatase 2c [Colletotrichum higginsianum]